MRIERQRFSTLMRDLPKLPATTENLPTEPARRSRRGRIVFLAFGLWTIFVAFALSRLLANSSPTVWIVHDEGSNKSAQKARAMFRTDAGLATHLSLGPLRSVRRSARGLLSVGTRPAQIESAHKSRRLRNLCCHLPHGQCAHRFQSDEYCVRSKPKQFKPRYRNASHQRLPKLKCSRAELAARCPIKSRNPRHKWRAFQSRRHHRRSTTIHRSALNQPAGPSCRRVSDPDSKPPPPPGVALLPTLLDCWPTARLSALMHSVHFYRRFRERERSALVLESNLANARLSALRAQLHPHFLFNSLNAIVALLRRDPRLAEATLMSLSDFITACAQPG